jgi:hypothetical protein
MGFAGEAFARFMNRIVTENCRDDRRRKSKTERKSKVGILQISLLGFWFFLQFP